MLTDWIKQVREHMLIMGWEALDLTEDEVLSAFLGEMARDQFRSPWEL